MYKRRNVAANQSNRFKGFLKNYLGIAYDKRYFELDVHKLTIRYAKDESRIDEEDAYVEQIRNIKGVYKNMVSMPIKNKKGTVEQVRQSTMDPNSKIDRGPEECGVNHAFEIETLDRVFTLYTQDVDLMEKFVYYL